MRTMDRQPNHRQQHPKRKDARMKDRHSSSTISLSLCNSSSNSASAIVIFPSLSNSTTLFEVIYPQLQKACVAESATTELKYHATVAIIFFAAAQDDVLALLSCFAPTTSCGPCPPFTALLSTTTTTTNSLVLDGRRPRQGR
jgi:hypothetical protein